MRKIISIVLIVFFYSGCVDAADYYNLYHSIVLSEQDKNKAFFNNQYLDMYYNITLLSEEYNAARSREQSLANRVLGAATMAATGIGGMQLASGLAEQNADTDAEQAMRAYLATFTCNYADGKYFKGGEKDIELPGSAELMALYSEYVTLANDLKTRKTALGIKPGIESESILDGATSGLYDDISVGKTSGVYTSLSRALSDPNGADAAAWAAQKEESSKKVTTGATVGGVGAAGGAIGNLIINRDTLQGNKQDKVSDRKSTKKKDKN